MSATGSANRHSAETVGFARSGPKQVRVGQYLRTSAGMGRRQNRQAVRGGNDDAISVHPASNPTKPRPSPTFRTADANR